jgi:hypothetical protein
MTDAVTATAAVTAIGATTTDPGVRSGRVIHARDSCAGWVAPAVTLHPATAPHGAVAVSVGAFGRMGGSAPPLLSEPAGVAVIARW